jgi:hypothetical protein
LEKQFPTTYWFGTITHYVVKGELLDHILGEPTEGTVVNLNQTHKIKWWYVESKKLYQRYKNHSMDSVKSALNKEGYK